MTFKSGDSVVVVYGSVSITNDGWKGTFHDKSTHVLTEYKEVSGTFGEFAWYTTSSVDYCLGIDMPEVYEVIPEPIYNSRLYKALQEDE